MLQLLSLFMLNCILLGNELLLLVLQRKDSSGCFSLSNIGPNSIAWWLIATTLVSIPCPRKFDQSLRDYLGLFARQKCTLLFRKRYLYYYDDVPHETIRMTTRRAPTLFVACSSRLSHPAIQSTSQPSQPSSFIVVHPCTSRERVYADLIILVGGILQHFYSEGISNFSTVASENSGAWIRKKRQRKAFREDLSTTQDCGGYFSCMNDQF